MASHSGILFTALTWNLFHGRDFPPEQALLTRRSKLTRRTERGRAHAQVNRPLLEEFAGVLDAVDWQVALLQEAPPRWLEPLGTRCRASGALALTSRNQLAPLRAALAQLNPDLIASNEGGSNMVLVRAPARIEEVERVRLARRPERRTALFARVAVPGGRSLAVANMHLSVPATGQGPAELVTAAELALAFAGRDPLILGGDLNLRPSQHAGAFEEVERRFGLAAPTPGRAIDHLLARGLDTVTPASALPPERREVRGRDGLCLRLSDHPLVTAEFGMR